MDDLAKYINPQKTDMIDPLSVIIKLFIFSYHPPGAKLSIKNHRITILSGFIGQGLFRRLGGDDKTDIAMLQGPIRFACNHYLRDDESRNKYRRIFETVIKGLSNLKHIYSTTPITYSIDQLIQVIEAFLAVPDGVVANEDGCIFSNATMHKMKDASYLELNSVWTVSRLAILFGYIDEILSVGDRLRGFLLEGLSRFMDCIDEFVLEILLGSSAI